MSIMFVRGGTPKSAKSNRMAESATDLGAYKYQDATVKELQGLIREGTLAEFKEFFDKCQEYNVHIVGSGDKVYRSDQVSMLIGLIIGGDSGVLRAITRSLGLRGAIHEQFMAEVVF